MNIKKQLLQSNAQKNLQSIVDYIGSSKVKFQNLMELFLGDDRLITQRASWVVTNIADNHPVLMMPYTDIFVQKLTEKHHDTITRNILRVFQVAPISEQVEGLLFEQCFKFASDPKEKSAIRAFSLTVLSRIAVKYPELKEEIRLLIQDHYKMGSPGFKSRAKAVLKDL